jgi:hypothetical protein
MLHAKGTQQDVAAREGIARCHVLHRDR